MTVKNVLGLELVHFFFSFCLSLLRLSHCKKIISSPFHNFGGTVGDSRILLPDVTSCSDFRYALFDCYVDLLSTPLLVLSLHVVFSISALLYSALARGMQTSERQY